MDGQDQPPQHARAPWSAAGEHREYKSGDAALGIALAKQRAELMQIEPIDIPGFKGTPDVLHQTLGGKAHQRLHQRLAVAEVIVQRSVGHAEIGGDALHAYAVGSVLDQSPLRRFKNGELGGFRAAPDALCRLCDHAWRLV